MCHAGNPGSEFFGLIPPDNKWKILINKTNLHSLAPDFTAAVIGGDYREADQITLRETAGATG